MGTEEGVGGGGARGRGSGSVIDSSSSENEFVLTTRRGDRGRGDRRGRGGVRGRGRGTVSDSTSTSSEDVKMNCCRRCKIDYNVRGNTPSELESGKNLVENVTMAV